MMTTLWDESRYDVFSPAQHHMRMIGATPDSMAVARAQRTVERYETYLADPALSEIDRCFYSAKLRVWRGHLYKLQRGETK